MIAPLQLAFLIESLLIGLISCGGNVSRSAMLDGALALCLLICCKCAAIPHKAGPSPNHNQVICIEFSVAISCVSTCL
jgi:hypothetical protein